MTPPADPRFWRDKETLPQDIERGRCNRVQVLEAVIKHARSGEALTCQQLALWHRGLLLGLSFVTDESLLGAYRGSSHPDLRTLGVRVGGVAALPAAQVDEALRGFFEELEERLLTMEAQLDPDKDKTEVDVLNVAELAGWAHGEWVRIHPFANGNGRMARLIANWLLIRFRLRPVIRLRPRPGQPYGTAAAASMLGDHEPITWYIVELLEAQQ